ncbi:3-hydroxyisobutyryl-CoA hydrolase, mitochondrial [Aphelenchoides besseyi]|nr:3-hydroxyisobutyryl-CoA hydrolase, mitochondrial [Aphelenchoides besseyi]
MKFRALISRPTFGKISRMYSSATSSDEVLLKWKNQKLIITLNRPKALNALNIPMVKTIYGALKEVVDNKAADLVIIKSNNEKSVLCWRRCSVSKSGQTNGNVHKEFFFTEYIVNNMIGTLNVPYVALIHGITMGGGCGLSINGRFRVATEKTMLAMPETALGLFPDVGATHFLSRLNHNLGQFLALTGFRLKGADVLHSGMATHYVNSTSLPDVEQELINLSNPTDSSVDKLLKQHQPNDLPPLYVIEKCFGANSYEDVLKCLQSEGSKFATDQLEELKKMSPSSLKVAFRQIKNGKNMKFSDVFPVEYRMAQHFCANHDFHEGCRAILIDKDRNPKWKPADISEVTDEMVDSYFAPAEVELNLNAKL